MSQANWRLRIAKPAEKELKHVPKNTREDLKQIAREASELEQPSTHSKIRIMRDCNGLFRLRAGNFRALAILDPPELRLLLIGKREGIYDRVEEALARHGD